MFDKALSGGKIVVVSSWVKYCTSCASQMKVLEKAKNDFDNIKYFKFDVRNKEIANLLNHKPPKEVCLLMSKIEEGDTSDPQKIDTWVTRSNYAAFSKIWICQISGISQSDWNSVSNGGYFNSLKWQALQTNQQIMDSKLSNNIIEYI